MSRKTREIKKNFKVFCEGDTEYNYIDEMRRQKRLSIALKPLNMKGGGYSNLGEQVKTDGTTNCLAKFIIIDGDRAIAEDGEKKKLRELLEYCILQNRNRRIPHFLIVNYPDFEYLACLHIRKYKGQNAAQYIVKELGYKSVDEFKADKKVYNVLNTNGNSYNLMLSLLKDEFCFVINSFSINKKQYEIKTSTVYDWSKLGVKGSNIHEFFKVINSFNI
ncbi:RloB domain-containing protein [Faecalicatena orotica]|uniref:RloB domain-containing protein n=1 Tax=Faecalicatena orotica TaxID=1544 RepID=UPI0032171042